jgi:hypothetical protein
MKSQRAQDLFSILKDPLLHALPVGSAAWNVLAHDELNTAQAAGGVPEGLMPSMRLSIAEFGQEFDPLGLDKTITNPLQSVQQARDTARSLMGAPPPPPPQNPVGEVPVPPDKPTDGDLPGFQGTVEQGEALGRAVMQGEDGVSIAAALYPNLDPTSRKEAVRRNMSSIKGDLQSVSKGEFNNARVENAMRQLRQYLNSNK